MRLDNGMKFDHCIGMQDRNINGEICDADVLTCHDKPLSSGECISVRGRAYRYIGDDNLGNSIFKTLEPFPKPETTIEKSYKNDLFVVLEIYSMENGHFYVWPYIQTGSASSDHFTRQGFQFVGEFESREAAIEAGWEAGKKRIDTLYSE
jgi:hypothetical protein